jgi:hypothetical protein
MTTHTLTFEDHLALTELKARYFRAVDTHDWPVLRAIFLADAQFAGFRFGMDAGVETLIEGLTVNFAEVQSQHRGYNPVFVVRAPGVVRGVWAMGDELHWPADFAPQLNPDIPGMCGLRGIGYYEDEYRLTSDGWRIAVSRLVRTRVEAFVVGDSRLLPLSGFTGDPNWLD